MDEDLSKAIDKAAGETRRHFDTVAERLESKLDVIAQGVVATHQRLDRLETTMRLKSSNH